MKILIYSAIYGAYDSIKEQPAQEIPEGSTLDWIMYSDVPMPSNTWKNEVMERSEAIPMMKAKYFKLNPPKGYDLTIWIDGAITLTDSDFVMDILRNIGDNPLLLMPHPHRDNAYDEVPASCHPKYDMSILLRQIKDYEVEGLPHDTGLQWCCTIVRKGETKKLDKLWWQQTLKYTFQDQISMAYVLWKLKQKVKYYNLSQHFNYSGGHG